MKTLDLAPRRPAMLVLAVAALGTAIMRSARLFLIEQALCRAYFEASDPAVVRPDGSVEESLCKSNDLQADVALVSGLFEVMTLISGLVATPAYTRLVPTFGKRKILFINVCSLTVGACYATAVCFFHGIFDIRLIWLTGLFDLLGGGLPVRNSLLYTYIAEVVEPDVLSNTLYQLSAFVLGMNFLGTAMGAALLNVDVWLLSSIGIGVSALTIPLVFLLANPSQVERQAQAMIPSTAQTPYEALPQDNEQEHLPLSGAVDAWAKKSTITQILRTMVMEAHLSFRLLIDLLRDPLKCITLLTYLSNETAIFVRVIFAQWATKRFGWSLADANAITSFQILVNGGTLLFMPLFSKHVLWPQLRSQPLVDFWVTNISLGFNIVGIFCVGIAPVGVFYIVSMGIYSLGAGLSDSLRSFATSAMYDEESVRKLYMGISIVETVAGLIGTSLWSAIFSAGIRSGETALGSIPFFAAGGLFSLALWLTYILHNLVKKRQSGVMEV